MQLEAIQALSAGNSAIQSAAGMAGPQPVATGGAAFGQMVADGLQQVNGQLLAQQTELQNLAVGKVENLHEVMIHMEEARLSFELLMQVRNRVLDAYQDVMKMQI